MRRRTFLIVLHWGTAFALLMMIKGGTAATGLRWAFVGAAGAWVAMALLRGPMARPGPKLGTGARAIFRPMHLGLYGLLAIAAGINAAALLGYAERDLAWTALLVLLAAGTLHGIFHLWRHTALNDGALRMITPRIWHKHL